MWYIHIQWNITQPLKRTKCLPFVATWVDFEGIILSEISQTEKDSIARYHLYVESKKYNKLVDMKKKKKKYQIQIFFLFNHSVISDSLWSHQLQHTGLPCPLLTSGVCSNSCLSNQWKHPTISSCHPLLLLPSIFPSS